MTLLGARRSFLVQRPGPMTTSFRSVLPLLVIALVSCSPVSDDAPSPVSDGVPEQVTYNYKMTQTNAGMPEWVLWGAVAQRNSGETVLHLTEVRMVFYENGVQSAELTSQTGEIDEKTRHTVARGDVHVVTEEGKELKSQVLRWDNDRELIHTVEYVHYQDGDWILTGWGLETDPQLSNVVIKERGSGEIPRDSRQKQGDSAP